MVKTFVYFAGVALEQDKTDRWIEVLKVGTFDQGDGSFEITMDNLHEAVSNGDKRFFKHGQDIPIFIGHKIINDPNGRIGEERHGGIDALKIEGDRLLGHADFIEDMAQKIRAKKFKNVSAEFTPVLKSETGELLGFGLTAVGMTNVPFLGLQPFSLSNPAAQEGSMLTASEQKLMVLTGASTPETACVAVETLQGETRTLAAENVKLKADNVTQKGQLELVQKGLDNQKALSVINKAITDNKPVAGMVKGFDEDPTSANPFPALSVLASMGGLTGAEYVFRAIAPLPKSAKGVDHNVIPNEDPAHKGEVQEDEEVNGIPVKALTAVQATQHIAKSMDVTPEKFLASRRGLKMALNTFLVGEGYTLVDADKPAKAKE